MSAMKTLWILAADAMFAACAKGSDEEVGAAPDRGDTTAVTTQGGRRTDTGRACPPTPTDTTVGQYPAPSDTTGYGTGTDSTLTQPTTPDTSSYVPDTGAAGVDTSAVTPSEPPA